MRLLLLLLLLSTVYGQNPGTYPPDQYPPGQYPPGQYPPNQYPVRLPGGIPVGIPVPEIKLPKRHPKTEEKKDEAKTDPNDVKITLASVDGALRRIGEKDLLLEAAPNRILRFRLLVKTQFRNKDGEPVRDSLLHPGDRLSIQVNTDDEETALRVILVRPGTAAEREAASKPVEEARVVAPAPEDLHNAHPTLAHETTGAPAESNPEPAPATPAPGTLERQPQSASVDDDSIIADARAAAASFTAELPNFLVEQVTTRYSSMATPPNWHAMDVVTAEVACVDGKEDYRNIAINGRPSHGPIENTGTWSTGEFAVTLEDILAPATAAVFTKRGEDSIGGRRAYVYDLAVTEGNSHWVIVGPDRRQYRPSYKGSMWIDKETCRVLRIEQNTRSLPGGAPYERAESVVEYGFVNIEGKTYLLPVGSQNLACLRGSSNCVRNVINFQNYRKFAASSDIKYDKFRSP